MKEIKLYTIIMITTIMITSSIASYAEQILVNPLNTAQNNSATPETNGNSLIDVDVTINGVDYDPNIHGPRPLSPSWYECNSPTYPCPSSPTIIPLNTTTAGYSQAPITTINPDTGEEIIIEPGAVIPLTGDITETSQIPLCQQSGVTCVHLQSNNDIANIEIKCTGGTNNGGWEYEFVDEDGNSAGVDQNPSCFEYMNYLDFSNMSVPPYRPTSGQIGGPNPNNPQSRVTVEVTPLDETKTLHSLCGGSGLNQINDTEYKEYCIWDIAGQNSPATVAAIETRLSGTKTGDATALGLTGGSDDMFSITNNSSAFLEYADIGEGDRLGLLHIKREDITANPNAMMIPAGPKPASPTDPQRFTDFRNFVANPPNNITIRSACYPMKATVTCEIDPINDDSIDIQAAYCPEISGEYSTMTSAMAGEACDGVQPQFVHETTTSISWKCPAHYGGTPLENEPTASCRYDKVFNGQCAPIQGYRTFSSISDLRNSGTLCLRGGVASYGSNFRMENTDIKYTCAGLNGGTDAECSARRTASCGPAASAPNGTYTTLSEIDTNDLCIGGSPFPIMQSGPELFWFCQGSRGLLECKHKTTP